MLGKVASYSWMLGKVKKSVGGCWERLSDQVVEVDKG